MKIDVILGGTVYASMDVDSAIIAALTDGSCDEVGEFLAAQAIPLWVCLAQMLIAAGYDFRNPGPIPRGPIGGCQVSLDRVTGEG